MISCNSFLHLAPLGPMTREILGLFDMMTPLFHIEDVILQPFCFYNKAYITLRQAFLAIYILCKSDEASCNILSFRTYKWF